jgi:aspartyl protease family protein
VRSPLVIALGILAIGLVVLLISGEGSSILGLDADRFAHLIYGGALLVVLGSAAIWRSGLTDRLRNLALWLFIILALVAGYQYRYELQDVASRVTAGLVPGSPLSVTDGDGRITVTLERGNDGHFAARALVQGKPTTLLVDTGATTTVLTREDAEAAGIPVDTLNYSVPVSTANGNTRAAAAIASEITIGEIRRRNVPVLVAGEGTLFQSLLGMSFISSLSGFDIRGDRMILRD